MLDRESACNRVFLARRFASVRARSFVFKLAAAPRSTMSSPLPYCRTNQTSSDVDVIGMITASARHRWTHRRRNGTKRKFFNDFSRACARVRTRRGAFGVCAQYALAKFLQFSKPTPGKKRPPNRAALSIVLRCLYFGLGARYQSPYVSARLQCASVTCRTVVCEDERRSGPQKLRPPRRPFSFGSRPGVRI
jgi:hypothetical protein